MKNTFATISFIMAFSAYASAQAIRTKSVPAVVQAALAKNYPQASKVSWEKEHGNYEANWGGKSGEDNAVQYTPAGVFVQMELAIPVGSLPVTIAAYVKKHYNGSKIKEAGKVTTAAGKKMYEAEVKSNDLLFDEQGNFLKKD